MNGFRPQATAPPIGTVAAAWGRRAVAVVALGVATVLMAQAPASAAPAGWSKPKRVFASSGAPQHSMKVDGAGKVHIAAQDGSSGIVYVTNALGSWTECRVSGGNDRGPHLTLASGIVHVAFARSDTGQEGIYTASGAPAGGPGDCGWALVQRHAGKDSHPSVAAFGGTLHLAFRTADKKLRYARGPAGPDPWDVLQTISGKCCTSPPSLDVTTEGSPRVAFGDGSGSDPRGVKFALRGGSKWKKVTVHGGRVTQVSMILDKSPDPFLNYGNSPAIVFVLKGSGTIHARKGGSSLSGAWAYVGFGRNFAPPDVASQSNRGVLIYGRKGNLWTTSFSGPIRVEKKISGSGKDGKPQIDLHGVASVVTFARSKGSPGIYYTRE